MPAIGNATEADKARLRAHLQTLSDDEFRDLEGGLLCMMVEAAETMERAHGRSVDKWALQKIDWQPWRAIMLGRRMAALVKGKRLWGEFWLGGPSGVFDRVWPALRPRYARCFAGLLAQAKAQANAIAAGEQLHVPGSRAERAAAVVNLMTSIWEREQRDRALHSLH